jgi:deoxyribonuclease V
MHSPADCDPPAPWPATRQELETAQWQLASATPPPWRWPPPARAAHEIDACAAGSAVPAIGGCFVCFPRGGGGTGSVGDAGWAAAAVWAQGVALAVATASGTAGAGYAPGLLALREGPLIEAALRTLPRWPDVLLVNSTGRDHPRGAGMALHLGARLGIPTVGVTNRLLVAAGAHPADVPGARSAFRIGDETVGCWVRTQSGTRPLAVHAAWRTDPDTAVAVVLDCCGAARTPAPLRWARRAAREARARARAACR